MSILGSVSSKIKQSLRERKEKQTGALFLNTKRVLGALSAEARRFGIEINNFKGSYYEVLGLKYTNDQKQIKAAYAKMMKRYHPDINKERGAKERAEEINEAYSTLKDRSSKAQYDSDYAKGSNKIGPSATKTITGAVLDKYYALREKDVEEFNQRVSSPQTIDSIKAAIEDVADWKARLNRSTILVFDKIWGCGKTIKKLKGENKGLLKDKNTKQRPELESNLVLLENADSAYNQIEEGIFTITESLKGKIGSEEQKVANRLRNSV